jgi:hypothetical protein
LSSFCILHFAFDHFSFFLQSLLIIPIPFKVGAVDLDAKLKTRVQKTAVIPPSSHLHPSPKTREKVNFSNFTSTIKIIQHQATSAN